MFSPGERVLVLTSYGELPGRVVAQVDAKTYRVCVQHPAYIDYRDGFHAASIRRPWDFAADEPGRGCARLALSRPAVVPLPWFWPSVMRRPSEHDDNFGA